MLKWLTPFLLTFGLFGQHALDDWETAQLESRLTCTQTQKPVWSAHCTQPLFHHGAPCFLYVYAQTSGQVSAFSGAIASRQRCGNALLGGYIGMEIERMHHRRRYSFGLEALHPRALLRFNCYNALSGRHRYLFHSNGQVDSERVLDGYDVGIQFRLPRLAWLHLRTHYYHWKGHSQASQDGMWLGLRADISPHLSLETGTDLGRGQIYVSIRLRPDQPKWIDSNASDSLLTSAWKPYQPRYLSLAPLEREERLIIERRRSWR
jgi:hypothetical protein